MKSAWRFAIAVSATGLLFSPTIALAQAAPAPTSNTPANDAIGPNELQNFSLKGTVTRPADQTPAPTPARPQTAPVRPPVIADTGAPQSQPRRAERSASSQRAPAPSNTVPSTTVGSAPAATTTTPPPGEIVPATQSPVAVTPPTVAAPSAPATGPISTSGQFSLWPWVAAALALALGGGFLLWRRQARDELPEGPTFDLLVPAPQPSEPEPQLEERRVVWNPAPAPAAPAPEQPSRPAPEGLVTTRVRPPAPAGIVASRLRPALEISFHPLRCQVDEDQVAIEFEVELFNAGAAPARAVLAEASLLNASATQDQELAAFFARPNGVGERLAVIAPMKRISFRSQVVAPRTSVQEYELAGRKAFVPVVAFNALYEWSGGSAQSSAAYLVGRDTQQDKLGPLRLDQGQREFRGLGARPLPSAVRT